MKKLWKNCHIATMQNGQYSSIENAAMVTDGKHIDWIGLEKDVPQLEFEESIDLNGAWVTPGMIDCHTHSVFGGIVVLSSNNVYKV